MFLLRVYMLIDPNPEYLHLHCSNVGWVSPKVLNIGVGGVPKPSHAKSPPQ